MLNITVETKLAILGHATTLQVCRLHKGLSNKRDADETGSEVAAIAEKMVAFMEGLKE